MPRLHNAPPSPQPPPPSPPPAVKQPVPQVVPQPPPVVSAPVNSTNKMVPLQPAIKVGDLPPEPHPIPENSMSSHSSPESDGCEPLPSTSAPYSDDSASQPFIGPATREDQQKAKMGFSAIKLGKNQDGDRYLLYTFLWSLSMNCMLHMENLSYCLTY